MTRSVPPSIIDERQEKDNKPRKQKKQNKNTQTNDQEK